MNKKYYVTWGPYKKLLVRTRPYEACRDFMRDILDKSENDDDFLLPLVFKVSERGFEDHDDDFFITTYDILAIMRESNGSKTNR